MKINTDDYKVYHNSMIESVKKLVLEGTVPVTTILYYYALGCKYEIKEDWHSYSNAIRDIKKVKEKFKTNDLKAITIIYGNTVQRGIINTDISIEADNIDKLFKHIESINTEDVRILHILTYVNSKEYYIKSFEIIYINDKMIDMVEMEDNVCKILTTNIMQHLL